MPDIRITSFETGIREESWLQRWCSISAQVNRWARASSRMRYPCQIPQIEVSSKTHATEKAGRIKSLCLSEALPATCHFVTWSTYREVVYRGHNWFKIIITDEWRFALGGTCKPLSRTLMAITLSLLASAPIRWPKGFPRKSYTPPSSPLKGHGWLLYQTA